MKTYYGNYLGLVVNSSDPEYRGRVQVFVPHIMPAIYEGWNKEGVDIQITCVGSNIPEGLTPEIHAKLVKILPWAEAASPIIGSSAPGNLFSEIVAGVKSAAGVVAEGVTSFFSQDPSSNPITPSGATGTDIANAANSNLNFSTANLAGTDGGNLGCAAAVSKIFKDGTGQDIIPGKKVVLSTRELYGHMSTSKDWIKVSKDQIQPGDILVTASGKQAGHTGVYTGVGTNTITSNSSSGFMGSARGTIQANYNLTSWQKVEARNPNESGVFRYVGPGAAAPSGAAPSSGTASPSGSEKTAPSNEPATPNPHATPNPSSEQLSTPKVPEQGAIQPTPGAGTIEGTVSGGGTATTTTGNTQVRNFSGSNPQAYATARAAAAAAGSPDPDVTASIAMFESGHLGSSMSKRANNPFGQTITQAQIGTNGIIGGTQGRDGQLHAVYDSLESAMGHHVKKWGSRYEAGNPGQTLNNMVAGNYNIESINGLPPGQYWKDGVLGRYNKLSGQTATPVEGLAGEPPSESIANSVTPNGMNVVNNTDSYGRTPIMNTNDMANGLFAYPNPGAMVWVFFREGNPLYPVYFAASYSSKEWSSAYRGGSESTGYFNDGKKISRATNFKPDQSGGLYTKFESSLEDTTGIQEKASLMLYHKGGSNLSFENGIDFYHSHFARRDEVEQDRFVVTKGYKDEWVEGDSSTNVRGDLIVKVGKFDQESMDALQELAKISAETNAQLTGSGGGSGGSSNTAGNSTTSGSSATTNSSAMDQQTLNDLAAAQGFTRGADGVWR